MGKILLFYKYVHIDHPKQVVKWQKRLCQELGLRGRILIAPEGINGTVGGSLESTNRYKIIMQAHDLFNDIDFKESPGSELDFPRLYITARDTMVNLGVDTEVLTPEQGGKHLTPDEVHALLSSKPDDLVVLDTRNKVETDIGKFTDSVIPDITTFRDFPKYIDKNLDFFKDKQVLMYCTGGVRCERATAYLKVKNVAKQVYQVEGGIHRYAEKYPEGFFRGKNYVFDNRIAVKINEDILGSCHLCAKPCDDYINCLNALCNKHVISCDQCRQDYKNSCSVACQESVANNDVPMRPAFGNVEDACCNSQTKK